MTIRIICIGRLKERFLQDAQAEFLKRLSRFATVEVLELPDEKAPEQLSSTQKDLIKRKEGERILSKVTDGDHLIATVIDGAGFTSEQFSKKLSDCMLNGKSRIVFAIGGSLGLSFEVISRADILISFSPMTFTHQIFRIMLLEQIYRAFKIMNNEPYHK